jgi:predicted  nucleic acid-binding Zn-ribbon protein
MRSLMNVQAPSSPLAVSTLANQAPASALIKEDKPDRKVAKLKSKVKDLENAKEKEARRAADALKKVEELEKELERHKAEIKAKSEVSAARGGALLQEIDRAAETDEPGAGPS